MRILWLSIFRAVHTGALLPIIMAVNLHHLNAQASFSVIHAFQGAPRDGATPVSPLIRDLAGSLYGTTKYGGVTDYGTVFKINSAGDTSLLHSFCIETDCAGDGFWPVAGLIQDSSGNLYGTTSEGVGISVHYGTVFRLTPVAPGHWQETILYNFTGGADGFGPVSGVIRDTKGDLYGTAVGSSNKSPLGLVYMLTPAASGPWPETVLHSFTGGLDGSDPMAGLLFDTRGNLYGTTADGGSGQHGVAFELKPGGAEGPWTESELFSFDGGFDGGSPLAKLVIDTDGNLYGTASAGTGNGGGGVVFRLNRSLSDPWSETILHTFCAAPECGDGNDPLAGVVRDSQGNLYGTTNRGGISASPNRYGVVYKIDSLGNETVLYAFTGGTDGSNPMADLIIDKNGTLYGTTSSGGDPTCSCGTVFKIMQ
jgi:uncharacterized repeat protein (TIGR03803 family)